MMNKFMIWSVGKKSPLSMPLAEGPVFEMTSSGAMLLIHFDRPSNEEIRQARRGDIMIGYLVSGPIIFIVSKFGSMNWMDSPFSIMLYPDHEVLALGIMDAIAESGPTLGLGIQTSLIDRTTGVVHSIRMIGASREFSTGLMDEIAKQLRSPFSARDYKAAIMDAYRTYDTSEKMAMAAKNGFTIRWRG